MSRAVRLWLALASVLAGVLGGCNNLAPPDKAGATKTGCPDDLQFFETRIWGPILSVQCIGCHSGSGPAGYTGLVLETPDQPDYLKHNLDVTTHVAERTSGGTSILLLRPSGQYSQGHDGGTLVPADSPAYGDLQAFVNRVTNGQCDSGTVSKTTCTAPTPGKRQLRRLTRDEYDNTVHDLFGIDSTWGQGFVADIVKNGFDNDGASLSVSPLLADQIGRAHV